jgi:AraC-like DNA-binding protein/quercetin dioxygenase-like cupin family protein
VISAHDIGSQAHTFGSVLRGQQWDGLSVEEVLMPPQLEVGEHRHDGAQIYFVLEGNYSERLHGRTNALGPGAAWFRRPNEIHENRVEGDDAVLTLIVTVEGDRLSCLERRSLNSSYLHSVLLNEVRSELVREIRSGDSDAVLALEGWTLLLLSRAQRALSTGEDRPPEWLENAVHFIEHAYLQPLSLDTVAEHVGVHPATLAAGFRRFHRRSVGCWIRDLRLRYAHDALMKSRRPIKEIALESGFYDQAHFGRHFKRHYGISPAAVRLKA